MGILALLTLITLVMWLGFTLAAWVDRHNPLIRPDGRFDQHEWWGRFSPVLAAAVLVWMVWMLAHLPGVP